MKSTDPEDLRMLSAYTRQQNVFHSNKPMLTTAYQDIIDLHRSTSIQQRADNLLRYIAARTNEPGTYIDLNSHIDFPLVDALTAESFFYFVDYWTGCGVLECIGKTMGGTCKCRITVPGWHRLGFDTSTSPRVFVAMSFDQSLNAAFEQGIRPAIEADCNMTCIRVDKLHFPDKICDRILAEIRSCLIVVADFTQHRNGVYFEAGYGLAMGKLVIWTCRKDEIDKAHFDTRQYPHIVWESPSELRERLRDRIRVLTRATA